MFEDAAELPTLEAPRVRLRPLRPADDAALFAIGADPDVTRYLLRPPMTHVGEARALREQIAHAFASCTLFQWAIALREDDALVGTATVLHVDTAHRRAEVGYVLGRAAWGHGYATEAVRRLLDHLFDDHDLYRVEADVDPRNTRSLGVLARLGFVREGLLRGRYHVAGEVQDSVLLGLLRDEWRGPVAHAPGDEPAAAT